MNIGSLGFGAVGNPLLGPAHSTLGENTGNTTTGERVLPTLDEINEMSGYQLPEEHQRMIDRFLEIKRAREHIRSQLDPADRFVFNSHERAIEYTLQHIEQLTRLLEKALPQGNSNWEAHLEEVAARDTDALATQPGVSEGDGAGNDQAKAKGLGMVDIAGGLFSAYVTVWATNAVGRGIFRLWEWFQG